MRKFVLAVGLVLMASGAQAATLDSSDRKRRTFHPIGVLGAFLTFVFALSSEALIIPIDSSDELRVGYMGIQFGTPLCAIGCLLPVSLQTLNVSSGGGSVDTDTLLATGLGFTGSATTPVSMVMSNRVEQINIIFDPPGFDPPFVVTSFQFDFAFTLTADVVFSGLSILPTTLTIDPITLASSSVFLGTIQFRNVVFSGFRDGQLVAQKNLGNGGAFGIATSIECAQSPAPSCRNVPVGPLSTVQSSVLGTIDLEEMLIGVVLPSGEITS
jgi:hypothetical protein